MCPSRTCSGTDQGREKFEYERTTAIGDNEDQATDFAIRIIGFLGLASVVLSLWSATVRPAGTRLSFDTGITPLIAVELARSKAEVAGVGHDSSCAEDHQQEDDSREGSRSGGRLEVELNKRQRDDGKECCESGA